MKFQFAMASALCINKVMCPG